MSEPLQGTASAATAISRVKYTHDAMIDLILANPQMQQKEIAAHFGFTQAWISRVFNSDAFQARLAQRKTDVIDPSIVMTIEEKLKTVAGLSLDIVTEKLVTTRNTDLAVKMTEISARALGYGARQSNAAVQQTFVVALPPKAASVQEWAAGHAAGVPQAGQVIDVTPVSI